MQRISDHGPVHRHTRHRISGQPRRGKWPRLSPTPCDVLGHLCPVDKFWTPKSPSGCSEFMTKYAIDDARYLGPDQARIGSPVPLWPKECASHR